MLKILKSGGNGAAPGTWKAVSEVDIDDGYLPNQVTGEIIDASVQNICYMHYPFSPERNAFEPTIVSPTEIYYSLKIT